MTYQAKEELQQLSRAGEERDLFSATRGRATCSRAEEKSAPVCSVRRNATKAGSRCRSHLKKCSNPENSVRRGATTVARMVQLAAKKRKFIQQVTRPWHATMDYVRVLACERRQR
ncbi:hypothetical protein ACOSQ3_004828 [Xanthoceras sorbifolium]